MTPDYPPRSGLDFGLVRDLLALLLVVACVSGLTWAAFATDWRLGVATVSVAAGCAGVFLGYER